MFLSLSDIEEVSLRHIPLSILKDLVATLLLESGFNILIEESLSLAEF